MQNQYDWDSIELSDAAIDSVICVSNAIEEQSDGQTIPDTVKQNEDDPSKTIVELRNIGEFLEWYQALEDEPDDANDLRSRSVQECLLEEKQKWQDVLQDVEATLERLDRLRSQYNDVSSKTNALHNDCEHLLDEQDKLAKRAEQIDSCLEYFNYYDRISAKLSSPYLQVNSDTLLPLLNQIDDCLDFVKQHGEFKEARKYEMKFKQLLARCLTMVHDAVFSVLENAVFSLESGIEQLSPENSFTLFYGRFRSHSAKVRPLIELLEQRLMRSSDYSSALDECVAAYTQQRHRLLKPSVEAAVADMSVRYANDHCGFVRTGCSFMLHICEDEESLFLHFFAKLSPQLTEMLRRLCSCLYDAFRPCIVHVKHLETLAELCHILQHEAIGSCQQQQQEKQQQQQEEEHSGEAFLWVCRAILADVQERLVFRTHVYARSEILGFRPSPGDLAYPEKLEMMRDIAESMKKGDIKSSYELNSVISEQQQQAGNMPMSPADLHGMWYPTVRRTLTLLSKLSRCLDRGTFQGLSQEVLALSVQSLLSAASGVAQRAGGVGAGGLDSDLFLMKHLLILREQLAPFHIDSGVKEASLDFSKMREAAFSLLSARARLLALNRNNAFLQFLVDSRPDVVESELDCRREVDAQLRSTCQRFIALASSRLIGAVREFNDKCASLGEEKILREQSFASPEKLHDLLAEAYKRLRTGVPALLTSLRLYLANQDTEHILFRPIKANVLQAFRTTESLVQQHYSEEDRLIIACPSAEQVNLLLNPAADQ